MTTTDLLSILPLITLVSWAGILLLVDAFYGHKKKGLTATLAAIGLTFTLGLSTSPLDQTLTAFNGMVVVDGFARYLNIIFSASGILAIALSYDYLKRNDLAQGEFYPLLLFSISGMMLMSLAADLIVVFLALELLSIPLYILAGFASPKTESEEAALKYFLLGAFAGGFVVFGVALIFGGTGSTALSEIVTALETGSADTTLTLVGTALILIGLGFKVAVVPFHMWTPDVYHGAPTPVTAFMAIGAKAAGFAALFRIFIAAFPSLSTDLVPIVWALSALTMFIGNITAIAQTNIKRMLAYSSIAHAGYIMMAFTTFGQTNVTKDAVASALFYLLVYAITNFGSWAVVIALEKAEGKGLALEDYHGLGAKYPVLAAAMVIFMLSFAGVPPTLGFVGKFFLFRTVLEGGFLWLAIIGIITSLISAFYYLRIVVNMYMHDGDPEAHVDMWQSLTIGATAVATIVLGLAAGPLFDWVSQAVLKIF